MPESGQFENEDVFVGSRIVFMYREKSHIRRVHTKGGTCCGVRCSGNNCLVIDYSQIIRIVPKKVK
jgi:hypothetical protein